MPATESDNIKVSCVLQRHWACESITRHEGHEEIAIH